MSKIKGQFEGGGELMRESRERLGENAGNIPQRQWET